MATETWSNKTLTVGSSWDYDGAYTEGYETGGGNDRKHKVTMQGKSSLTSTTGTVSNIYVGIYVNKDLNSCFWGYCNNFGTEHGWTRYNSSYSGSSNPWDKPKLMGAYWQDGKSITRSSTDNTSNWMRGKMKYNGNGSHTSSMNITVKVPALPSSTVTWNRSYVYVNSSLQTPPGTLSDSSTTTTTTTTGSVTTPSSVTMSMTQNDYYNISYSWNGWRNSGGSTYGANTAISISGNDTFYPSFTQSLSTRYYTNYIYYYGGAYGSGSMSSSSGSRTYSGSAAVTVKSCGFSSTNSSYVFNGWNTDYSGNGTRYTAGQTVYLTSNLYLYAQWKLNNITITAYSNGGTISSTSSWSGTGTSATKTIIVGNSIGSFPNVTRTGYNLAGWYSSGGTKYTTSSTFSSSTAIYARWDEKIATITYNANGGTLGDVPSSQTISYTSAAYINSNSPTRSDGYFFRGWSTTPTSSIISYQPGNLYKSSYVEPSNITLYARWQQPSVKVYTSEGWKNAVPFIYHNGSWHVCECFIYKEDEWKPILENI